MKNIHKVFISIALVVSFLFILVACNYDDSALLDRIAQLEQKVNNSSGDYDDSALLARIAELESQLEALILGNGYDDSAMRIRIEQLERELNDALSRLNDVEADIIDLKSLVVTGGNGEVKPFYELGETVHVYSNGIRVFSITYIEWHGDFCNFSFTNHGIPNATLSHMLTIRTYSSSTGTTRNDYFSGTSPYSLGETRTFSVFYGGLENYIYFSHPYGTTFITIAVFKI